MKEMAFGRIFLFLACFAHVLYAAHNLPRNTSQVNAQLFSATDPAPKVKFQTLVPVFATDGCKQILELELFRKRVIPRDDDKTMCICIKAEFFVYEDAPFCDKASRLCVKGQEWYGRLDYNKQSIVYSSKLDPTGKYEQIDIKIALGNRDEFEDNAAVPSPNGGDASLGMAKVNLKTYEDRLPEIEIAFVHFVDLTAQNNLPCVPGLLNDSTCADTHSDQLYIKAQIQQINPPKPNVTRPPPPVVTTPAATTTVASTTSATTKKEEEEVSGANVGLYVGIGVGVAILLIIILLVILFLIQGVWCCGLCCFEIVRKGKYRAYSKEENKDDAIFKGGSSSLDKPAAEEKPKNAEMEGAVAVQPGNDVKVSFKDREFVQPTQDTETKTQDPKKKKPLVTDEKKGGKGKTSKSSSSSAAADTKDKEKETTTAADTTKKRPDIALAPNMLLLATNEDPTQSEAKSKRKNKVDKNYKDVPPTKNDPTLAAAKKTDAKTGIPKGETDLNDENGIHVTKGVSATQGDKDTENIETRPTQHGTATGAATQIATTQAGTRTTQGGATTAGRTKQTQDPTMATGMGRTRATAETQMPSKDTNETQIPTGATRTRATQRPTGATQTGTTQAMTGTTQHGTTMATGKTRGGGTNPTQARTGTRQTGETQNPEEMDIDPTQLGGQTAGTNPTAGTQFPTDADADPTQNPTAFTGDGGRTSKTQIPGTGTTQVGTSKTRTRETQKKTN